MVCLLEEISEPWEVSMQQKCSRGAHHGKGKVPLVSLCREAAPCSSVVFRGKEHTAGPASSLHLANIISEGDLMICQSGKRVLQFILATLPSRIMWLRFDFFLFIFFLHKVLAGFWFGNPKFKWKIGDWDKIDLRSKSTWFCFHKPQTILVCPSQKWGGKPPKLLSDPSSKFFWCLR